MQFFRIAKYCNTEKHYCEWAPCGKNIIFNVMFSLFSRREGFNLRCESADYPNRRLRLGFFAKNENDCLSCQSYVGLGPMVRHIDYAPACGNHRNQNNNYAAFCYIMIQWIFSQNRISLSNTVFECWGKKLLNTS